jgi:hypothetical protein
LLDTLLYLMATEFGTPCAKRLVQLCFIQRAV